MISGAAGAVALTAPAVLAGTPAQPLRAEPRPRRLSLEYRKLDAIFDAYDVLTDAPTTPRAIIRREVIDEAFGADAYDSLDQPDHWRMIDAGWFSGSDLDRIDHPDRSFDPLVLQWHAWHKPASEAYWLLIDLFPEAWLPGGGAYLEAYDLYFCIHPCTPMVAEASLRSSWRIEAFAEELAARAPRLSLDTSLQDRGVI
jgi:hypothetical protein